MVLVCNIKLAKLAKFDTIGLKKQRCIIMTKRAKATRRLYHGTTEIIAKNAPVKGLLPYEVSLVDNGKLRAIGASTSIGLSLTDSYVGVMAFDTCTTRDRWGLIEIDPDELDEKQFVPHELFLLEKSKKKIDTLSGHQKAIIDYREKLSLNHKFWKDSLSSIGLCVYQGVIPISAITKITIYDWKTNWFITREVFNVNMTSKHHKMQIDRHKLMTRWLMCEAIDPSEWVSDYKNLKSNDREPISAGIINKSGLDFYYQKPINGRWK